jgi:hypothetical protein
LNGGWFQDKNRQSWHRNRPLEANDHQERGLAQQLLLNGKTQNCGLYQKLNYYI